MKFFQLLLIGIFLFYKAPAQKKSFFFKEFGISINKTQFKNSKNNRFGFGLGAYHSFRPEKTINITVGIEYNRQSFFLSYQYEGHFSSSKDITYYINNLSFPLSLRVNIGNKPKLFFEPGVFIDLFIGGKSTGTRHSYYPYKKEEIIEFNEKARVETPNYGPSLGIGLKFPLSKHELIIKSDYRFGITGSIFYPSTNEGINYLRLVLGYKI